MQFETLAHIARPLDDLDQLAMDISRKPAAIRARVEQVIASCRENNLSRREQAARLRLAARNLEGFAERALSGTPQALADMKRDGLTTYDYATTSEACAVAALRIEARA